MAGLPESSIDHARAHECVRMGNKPKKNKVSLVRVSVLFGHKCKVRMQIDRSDLTLLSIKVGGTIQCGGL